MVTHSRFTFEQDPAAELVAVAAEWERLYGSHLDDFVGQVKERHGPVADTSWPRIGVSLVQQPKGSPRGWDGNTVQGDEEDGGKYNITVNKRRSRTRQAAILAHELGHVVQDFDERHLKESDAGNELRAAFLKDPNYAPLELTGKGYEYVSDENTLDDDPFSEWYADQMMLFLVDSQRPSYQSASPEFQRQAERVRKWLPDSVIAASSRTLDRDEEFRKYATNRFEGDSGRTYIMADRPQDHVIDKTDEFAKTPIARWDANIRAIRLIKELEADNRTATPEEQRQLAQYSGFGDSAFEKGFRWSSDRPWVQRREELEELVTADEMDGIRRSRVNAFYTTPDIVRSMWSTLGSMGLNRIENPKILEPSVGSGRFLGMQPPESAANSERVAVELDPLTAKLVKHTYPETRVHATGFQDAPVPDNHFDVAISNVPFGNIRVFDKEFNGNYIVDSTSSMR